MRKISFKAVLTSALIALGAPAQADCDGLQPLAVMHDAYRVLVEDQAPFARSVAANELLQLVPVYTAKTFADSFAGLSLAIEVARLEKVLFDAFFLGRDALAGRLTPGSVVDFHQHNANWLTDTIARTGCFTDPGDTGSTQASLQQIKPANPPKARSTGKAIVSKLSKVDRLWALSAFLAIILASGTGYLIYHSRHFRIQRVSRLPRHAIAFVASASFESTTNAIIVLDISLGGAKIECDHPPLAKEKITLHLPCGSIPATIVWATAFYAGVMFEEHLSEEDLQTVLTHDGISTRSRLSNVF